MAHADPLTRPDGTPIRILTVDDEPSLIEGLNADLGSTVTVFFRSGDATGETAEIPVLDGTLSYYEDLAP